jgi:ABC-type transport system substrate-binding protein
MNKAINRKELLRALYKNRASPMYVHGFYPGLEGWDPSWEKRFPEMYGYDPAAAKRLLAEAGYPNGFKAKAWLYPFAGAPEMIAVMEAVAAQLREVGIEIALDEADWVAAVRPKLQKREAHGYLWADSAVEEGVEPQLAVFNVGKGIGHIFQTDEIYKMWEDLLQITDAKARDASCARSATTSSRTSRPSRSSTSTSRSSWTPRSSRTGPSLLGWGRRRPHVANHGVQTGDACK